LDHGPRGGRARQLRTLGHYHPQLRRDHIQPFRGVLTDHRHRRPAAGTCGVLGRQRHLDPWQLRRQRAAARPPLGGIVLAQLGIALFRLRIFLGDRLLEGFQAELQLFLRQTLRAGPEMHPRQLQEQVAQSVILRQ
jgi:hypothetical protein